MIRLKTKTDDFRRNLGEDVYHRDIISPCDVIYVVRNVSRCRERQEERRMLRSISLRFSGCLEGLFWRVVSVPSTDFGLNL